MNSLFRKEFLEEAKLSASAVGTGGVQNLHTRLLHWMVVALLGVCGVGGIFIGTRSYKESVAVIGVVEPRAGVSRVHAPNQAVVRSVEVAEGQWIEAGQPLVRLVQISWLADGQSRALREQVQLEDELLRLDQQIAVEARMALAVREGARAALANSAAALGMARSMEALTNEQVLLEQTEGELIAALLEQGAVSHAEQRQLQRRRLTAERECLSSQQLRLRQEQDQRALRRQLSDEKWRWQTRYATLTRDWQQLESRLERVDLERVTILKAPVAGRVAFLQAHRGMHTTPHRPLLSLVDDRQPKALLLLDNRAVAKARVGQRVALRFTGLPFTEHGFGRGEITAISAAPLSAEQLTDFSGVHGEFYRAEVHVHEWPDHEVSIRAGMQFQADIVVSEQPIWRWLLRPLREGLARF